MATDWEELFKQAENGSRQGFSGVTDITVAEELAFGNWMSVGDLIVVRDTNGLVWILYETGGVDGDYRGLTSHNNVVVGMRLRVSVSNGETRVFCITPETTPSGTLA